MKQSVCIEKGHRQRKTAAFLHCQSDVSKKQGHGAQGAFKDWMAAAAIQARFVKKL